MSHFDPLTLIQPVLLFAGTLIAGLLLRRLIFTLLHRWSERTNSKLGDLITETLSGSTILWTIIFAFDASAQGSELPPRYRDYAVRAIGILWIWSITAAVSRFAGRAVRHYGAPAKGVKSVTSLTEKLVQIAVFALGIAWTTRVVFKTDVAGIWGTLGIGGLAVALALQDTLSNLFAGFYVSISGLVNLGDYLKLNSGEEGHITDITWRCTTMRTSSNNLIVIPNNKLAQAIYTNYSLPETRAGISMNLSVALTSDVVRVRDLILEETRAAIPQIQGALNEPPPNVQFNGPTEGGLTFQVGLSIARFPDQGAVLSELRMRLVSRLQREGVRFELPAKAVIVDKSAAES